MCAWSSRGIYNSEMILHDHTPAFVTFFEATHDKSDEEKLRRFWSDMHPVSLAFYDQVLSSWKRRGKDVEQTLLGELAFFETYQTDFKRRQLEVPGQLEEAARSFKEAFPDFSLDFEVHLLHSLDEMDGGTRLLNGEHRFIFGLDAMSRYHSWQDETAFFHHELYHFYSKQLHASTDWYDHETLLLNLWEEGLAVYVSHLLNPTATYDELSLNIPAGMAERVWENRVRLANDLLPKLMTNDEEAYRDYFTGRTLEKAVPSRAGYFLGYIVMSELAKTHPLAELLKPASKQTLLALVERQLNTVASLKEEDYVPNF